MNEKPFQDPLEKWSEKSLLLGLFLFNLLLKIALVKINRAEYTDGILQITLFSQPNRLYPPLFTILVNMTKPLLGNPELAGRFISVLAGSILVIPIFLFTRRIFNKNTAFFAGLVYTVSPMALRWSLHAMTDALFTLLFFGAVMMWIRAAAESPQSPSKRFAAATILAVLATLTRYQGILLIPPIFLLLLYRIMKKRGIFRMETLCQGLWALPVFWVYFYGFRHPEQFVERAGGSWMHTIILILNVFESFLAYSPYFLTWPVCFFMIAGIFYHGEYRKERSIFLWMFLYLTSSLLLLQSAFSSFQSRYLLPLLPLASVFAGRGMDALRLRWKRRKVFFDIVFSITILYGIGFGLVSVFLQRETFADIKDAAVFLGSLPPGTAIYSNETYKDLGPVKMRYWSQREIQPYDPSRELSSGSILCLSSAYGGAQAFQQHGMWLSKKYQAIPVKTYYAQIIPMLPDVMQEPHTHQNPLAMTFRYTSQQFITNIYRIP